MSGERVLVGMSGGVDSAVTAALLVEQGYDVVGATLRIWEGEDDDATQWHERSCCKVGLARFVAERLKIPYHILDAREAFETFVIEDFSQEYIAGRTPNPCVRCNWKVKFARLLHWAHEMGIDKIATGHYARIESGNTEDPSVLTLKTGRDPRKDQSYFLYRLDQKTLQRTLFPLGGFIKKDVLERARGLDLPVDELRESQEVCFVNQKGYQDFLSERIPSSVNPGKIVTTEGVEVGTHRGIAFHTIGQRRGLGVSALERHYVVQLDPERNEVVLGSAEDLLRYELTAGEAHWILPMMSTSTTFRAMAKIRYRGEATPATIVCLGTDRFQVLFDRPQKAISPGQSVVLYQGEDVLGGGIIEA